MKLYFANHPEDAKEIASDHRMHENDTS